MFVEIRGRTEKSANLITGLAGRIFITPLSWAEGVDVDAFLKKAHGVECVSKYLAAIRHEGDRVLVLWRKPPEYYDHLDLLLAFNELTEEEEENEDEEWPPVEHFIFADKPEGEQPWPEIAASPCSTISDDGGEKSESPETGDRWRYELDLDLLPMVMAETPLMPYETALQQLPENDAAILQVLKSMLASSLAPTAARVEYFVPAEELHLGMVGVVVARDGVRTLVARHQRSRATRV